MKDKTTHEGVEECTVEVHEGTIVHAYGGRSYGGNIRKTPKRLYDPDNEYAWIVSCPRCHKVIDGHSHKEQQLRLRRIWRKNQS